VSEVFEAIADPEHMKNYFISESTGRMEAGKEINWKWPEFDVVAPIRVEEVHQDKLISFYWDHEDRQLLVRITFEPYDDHSTIVRASEAVMPNDEKGINWLKGNTEGWANFLACLKAYLEYGINLRKGAFDYR
jgi:uncharacterized protein YndB with AHSA1/START domain